MSDSWVLANPTDLDEPTARIVVRPQPTPTPDKWVPEEQRTWQGTRTLEDAAQTADDAVRAAANTVTFGMADRLAGAGNAALSGGVHSYEETLKEELRKSAVARQRSPISSVAGDVAGVVAIPQRIGPAIATSLGRGVGARAVGYGAEGALHGAAQGAGNTYTGNPADYLKSGAMGGVLGGVTGAATGAAFAPRPNVTTARVTPAENRARAEERYGDLHRSSAVYDRPDVLAARADQLEQDLLQRGYYRDPQTGSTNAPQTFQVLDFMRRGNQPGGMHTPGNIEVMRQILNKITDETDGGASRAVKDALNDFLVNPPAGVVRPGTERAAAEVGKIVTDARGNWAAAERGQKLADMRESAVNAAAAANSGRNFENITRQKYRSFVDPNTGGRERLAGYNAEEQAAVMNVVRPGWYADRKREAGNALSGGGGVGTPILSILGGGAAGGLANYFGGGDPSTVAGLTAVGGVLPFLGRGMRSSSNRAAEARILNAEEVVNRRSPLFLERAAVAPTVPGPSRLSEVNAGRLRDAITLEMLNRDYRE